ncbi:uncharacterized protein TRUGW13939_01319 [Talaromyces rugulosus]|uniref:Uncharacterized protein n=1 Tax=Talaromyces rugulosus TaxID=121627 RepID=A0A7H8QJX2_TALRU|nr:uncharacterized protein TRUGW13939_01319 [Talaromyces rugulosus]QKX54234.1 hypothetical protein TRUGW13939_01319 [Talaromyces rugulosus]
MLRQEIRRYERTLEKTKQTLERQHDQNEDYHRSCVKKLSQIIDIIQEVKREPISEARKLQSASSLSSPVSTSSRQQRESSSHGQRRDQRHSITPIRSNVSNRHPNSRNPKNNERLVGDFRRPVHAHPSVNSSPDSETSRSISNSRALILRSRHMGQEHNSNSGDANIHEEFEIQPNALVLRTGARSQNRRTSTSQAGCEEIGQNYPVYHEYEDNSREMYYLSRAPSYVRGSESGSDSAAPSENQFSSKTYIPMPPFAKADLNELSRRQTKRTQGQEEHE